MPDSAPADPRLPLAALRFVGADAAQFLQGQLTADCLLLPRGEWRYAAYCSPKGRILANGVLLRADENDFAFVVDSQRAIPVGKRLSMFVLRAKVKIENDDGAFFAVVDDGAQSPHRFAPDPACESLWRICEAPQPRRTILWARDEAAAEAAQAQNPITATEWRRAQIESGIGWIGDDNADSLIPQMIDWDSLGGVSFQKGCYVGQEIIARLHYRGRAKKRAALLRGAGAPPPRGASLTGGGLGAQSAGEVVMTAEDGAGGFVALASAREEIIESGAAKIGETTCEARGFARDETPPEK